MTTQTQIGEISVDFKHDGGLLLSTIYNGHLVQRTYYGYSRTLAIQLFKQFLKENSR